MSRRLAALADLVIPGRPVADVGTDHARLPELLVRGGHVPLAIGIDRSAAALAAAAGRGLPPGVELRLGDGLEPLRPDEVTTVVLAGMGGRRIAAILARAPHLPARVVTQPNGGAEPLRRWLARHGRVPVAGRLVEERGRFYPTEAWERGTHAWTGLDLLVGPRLLDDPALLRWLARERRRCEAALAAARSAGDGAAVRRLSARRELLAAAQDHAEEAERHREG